ncbi:MAG: glycosyltransferase family 2 protein [Parvibaculum sp.]|nr:glycosyltransferase family 2 protein [Parvibaculum sp.]
MDRPRLAILIPAFREAATIGSVVKAAREYAEVIVVDDASPDETGTEAAGAGAIVIRNKTNLGYDGTLNRAFEEALARGFAFAITMDADGEHDPALVAKFSALLADEGVPLVLGVRPHKQRFAEVVMGLRTYPLRRARHSLRHEGLRPAARRGKRGLRPHGLHRHGTRNQLASQRHDLSPASRARHTTAGCTAFRPAPPGEHADIRRARPDRARGYPRHLRVR